MINPKKELLKWGPIDGRPIYINYFVEAFEKYPRFIDGTWPDTLGFFKDDKIIFVIEYPFLRKHGRHLFRKYVMNKRRLKQYYQLWIDANKKIKAFENKVDKRIPTDKITKLFIEWNKVYVDFWMKGFLPELANYGEEQVLKNEILKFNKTSFIEIFEALSAPEGLSFFQKEELELLKIKLIKNKKKQLEKLKEHQKRFYWLRNNYAFTKVLGVDYFRKELKRISLGKAKKKIEEINDYVKNVRQKKKKVIRRYKVSEEITDIASRLAYCIWWQDYRKQFIFIANHVTAQLIRKISRLKKIPFKELCYYSPHEIEGLLKYNKRINAKERYGGFTVYYHERGKTTYLAGKKARDLIKPYTEIKVSEVKELKGIVVSKGKARGEVKILYSPKNLNKMEKGDILVAPMTSPDFIVAMRKAAAVITDEGGMTCHAAIVSRELKIPCIVATRIATKVLKDGDLVEVDAEKGIVKILKK